MRKDSLLSWRGLIPQLLASSLLPLTILLVVITFGVLSMHQQSMRTLAGERDERAARAAANTLSTLIRQRETLVRSLALHLAGVSDQDLLQELLQNFNFALQDFDGGLAFLTPEGQTLAALGNMDFWENNAREAIATLPTLPSQENPVIFQTVAHPLRIETYLLLIATSSSGETLAAGAFSQSRLIQIALAPVFAPGEGGAVYVVDANQQVLYNLGTPLAGEDPATHPGVQEALQGESGATYTRVNGSEHVVAYSPVAVMRWALVLEEPWETVASPMLRITENAPLVLIPALLITALALWYATRSIVQPLQKLESRAADLGWGNFATIEQPVGGIAEIRNLQNELIHLARKVHAAQEGLRGYIGAITLGQEEERRRLARELHDETLQALIALNQRIQLAALSKDNTPQREEQVETLAEIQKLAEQTIQDLRRVTRALRPVYLEELGLSAALEMLAREAGQGNGLQVDFRLTGTERRLPAASELALYRIAQEALNNITRHAGANQASVRLVFADDLITLEVSDNGRGFEVPESPAAFAPSGHFGLLGLHERAEMIGAQLEIQSTLGQGARITVILSTDQA